MAAVVRVKRRLDQDPVNSLLLSCKRFKSNEVVEKENDPGEVKSIFKFAGTLTSKNVDVETHVLEAIRREKLQKEYKRHLVDIAAKSRKTHLHTSANNRFKVVSTLRSLDVPCDKQISNSENNFPSEPVSVSENKGFQSDAKLSEKDGCDSALRDDLQDSCLESYDQSASASSVFCLFDIEGELTTEESDLKANPAETILCNGQPMAREKVPSPHQPNTIDGGYVYDIYYMNSPQFDFRNLENILAIEALREDLIVEEQGRRDSEDEYGDDEDSNDESNWRNDYPDEDEDIFVDAVCGYDDEEHHQAEDRSDYETDGSYTEDYGVSKMIGRRLKICDDDDDDDDELGDEGPKIYAGKESNEDIDLSAT